MSELLESNEKYKNYVEDKSPDSKVLINCVKAFIIGGIICCLGQLLYELFIPVVKDKINAQTVSSIILVFTGAFFTGINIYSKIGKFAGAGSIVPITGFANSIVSPAMEFRSEGIVTGVGAKMFNIAGPVLVYGFLSSFIAGLIFYLVRVM